MTRSKIAASISLFILLFSYSGYTQITFSEKKIIQYAELENISYLQNIDMDADGDMDIIGHSTDDNLGNFIFLYKNTGNGTFGEQQRIIEVEKDNTSNYHVAPADFDGDSDIDIIAWLTGDSLCYYENIGNETFTNNGMVSTDYFRLLISFDIENDGDEDVLYVVSESWPREEGKIVALLNDGSGSFTEKIINNHYYKYSELLSVEDLDNDGDKDLILDCGQKIYTLRNLGNSDFSDWQTVNASNAHNIYVKDLNNDQYNDIFLVQTYGQGLAWFKNKGNGTFDNEQEIVDDHFNALPLDLDGDNDLDILSYTTDNSSLELKYALNDGAGHWAAFQTLQNISMPDLIVAGYGNSDFFLSGQLFGENRNDLIFGGDDSIYLFRDNGLGSPFTQITLTQSLSNFPLYPFDLDQDSDTDIITISPEPGGILLFENEGQGVFDQAKVLLQQRDLFELFFADLDNDGLSDIIARGYGMFYFRNMGNGVFDQATEVSALNSIDQAFLVDVENDNDIDIIITDNESDIGGTFILQNNGSASFTKVNLDFENNQQDGYAGSVLYLPVDLDHDGDTDLFSTRNSDDGMVKRWFNNNKGEFTIGLINGLDDFDSSVFEFIDLNADDLKDLVFVDGNKLRYAINQGNGNFEGPHTAYTCAKSIDIINISDINQDTKEDVLLAYHNRDKKETQIICLINHFEDGFLWFEELRIDKLDYFDTPYYYQLKATDLDGDAKNDVIFSVDDFSQIIWYKTMEDQTSLETTPFCDSDSYILQNNYPNPFNPATQIQFILPKQSKVKVVVYDIQGKVVEELLDKPMQAGSHSIFWDASRYSSGNYFIRLKTEDYEETRKCLLLK